MMIIAALALRHLDMELVDKDPGTYYGLGAGRPEKTRIRYRRKA